MERIKQNKFQLKLGRFLTRPNIRPALSCWGSSLLSPLMKWKSICGDWPREHPATAGAKWSEDHVHRRGRGCVLLISSSSVPKWPILNTINGKHRKELFTWAFSGIKQRSYSFWLLTHQASINHSFSPRSPLPSAHPQRAIPCALPEPPLVELQGCQQLLERHNHCLSNPHSLFSPPPLPSCLQN